MSVKLFKQNSAEDYVLRGFSQIEILDFTGVDVGYHGNALKASLKGIDRYAYKILYVQTTCSSDTILDTLDKYSKGLDYSSHDFYVGSDNTRKECNKYYRNS